MNSGDHGRLFQSASSFYDATYPNFSWIAECYNPTEAGNAQDANGLCTSSHLLEFSTSGNYFHSKTQMAYFAGTGTSDCSNPVNTNILSDHIFEKNVTIGISGMPNVVKYEAIYTVPTNETHVAGGQFEVMAFYANSEFDTYFHYDQYINTLINTSTWANSEYDKPIIMSTADGSYAVGIYSQEVPRTPEWGKIICNGNTIMTILINSL